MRARLVTAIRVYDSQSLWITSINGAPVGPTEVTLTAGLYYITGDGTATDLTAHIMARVFAVAAVTMQLSFTTAGIVGFRVVAPTVQMTINWEGSGTARDARNIRDALRYSGTTTSFAPSASGSRCHLGGFYPSHYLHSDLETLEPVAEQFVPDTGNAQTLYIATRQRYRLRLRASGYPRPGSAIYTEYHDMRAWYLDAVSGRPFRLYPDTTVTTAYAEETNWMGYRTMTLVPDEWALDPEQDNWYKLWTRDLTAIQYI